MGYSSRSGKGAPQAVYWYRREGAPPELAFQLEGNPARPHYETLWKHIESSDPWGHARGMTPEFLVGRYGNWWGAQWSAGRELGFDGIGPTDYPYVDALDRVALEHDIECWIAGEKQRNPGAAIQTGSKFRVENVFWEGSVGPRVYTYTGDMGPHMRARQKMAALPGHLKERLKASIYLYAILNMPHSLDEAFDIAGRRAEIDYSGVPLLMRPDVAAKTSVSGIGLDGVNVTLGDLIRVLRNPRKENIPLSAGEVAKIRDRILKSRKLRADQDPYLKNLLRGL